MTGAETSATRTTKQALMRAVHVSPGPTAYAIPSDRLVRSRGRRAGVSSLGAGVAAPRGTSSDAWAEDLWNTHGQSVYSLACALLGDETAAMRVVALAMVDFARSDVVTSTDDTRRSLARHVYRHSTPLVGEPPRSAALPPAMGWLARLAQLQRSSLALCVFGGYSYTDAADLLDVTPLTVAGLLSSGLEELRRLSRPVIVI